MRLSTIAIASFFLVPFSSAAPVKRGIFDGIANAFGGLATGKASLPGIVGAVAQSIENPRLTAARLKVIGSLSASAANLNRIATQATTTGNSGVSTLVTTAQGGIGSAHQGVNNIGAALISGNKPNVADQKQVAVGIKTARDAVGQMAAAITTPNAALSNDITNAQNSVASLQQGGLEVLQSSGLTFADLGLPDNFAN